MTKEFTVFQAQTTREQKDHINSVGWGGLADKGMESMRVYQDTQFHGAEAYEEWMFEHYTPVVGVQANDLEHVFQLTNLWHDEGAISRISERVRSTSVGDIVLDVEADEYYMVDMFGFKRIQAPADAYEEVA